MASVSFRNYREKKNELWGIMTPLHKIFNPLEWEKLLKEHLVIFIQTLNSAEKIF
jgi:hypothetical protein